MNHKYLSSETFEVIDNIIEVDEDIAETISVLNKKGYYTKFCCSGHAKDPRLYEMYNKKNNVEYEESHLGYVINNYEDSYDILMPYTFTAVYIMFSDNYNFENLPNGFYKVDDVTIEMIIDYYSNGQRKKWNKFRKKYPHLKDVSLHGLRHSYCSMQMNENDKLSPSDVAKIMGHSQLTTTYRYTHSNEDKTEDAISIFYDEQKAPYRTFNFNQVLSVITGRKYASTNEINDLLDYVFPNSVDVPINERLSQVKEAILDDYPNLENISDDGLNVTNIWDWLEEKKNEYGDKFAISGEIVAIKNNTLEL